MNAEGVEKWPDEKGPREREKEKEKERGREKE